jgi:hypothetical protein
MVMDSVTERGKKVKTASFARPRRRQAFRMVEAMTFIKTTNLLLLLLLLLLLHLRHRPVPREEEEEEAEEDRPHCLHEKWVAK